MVEIGGSRIIQRLLADGVSEVTDERALCEAKYRSIMHENLKLSRLVSYVGNKSVPLLRLFRYKEAFSLELVNYLLDKLGANESDLVYDPFSGMGTTLFGAMLRGIDSVGTEKLPVAVFVASTLPKFFLLHSGEIADTFAKIKAKVDSQHPASFAHDVAVMNLAYKGPELRRLLQWKSVISELPNPMGEVFKFLLLAVLESTSYASNDGQFLRLKPQKVPLTPDDAIYGKVLQAETDLIAVYYTWPHTSNYLKHIPVVYEMDARKLNPEQFSSKPSLLITSPPYPNRYDYTRSYCLELCFSFVKDFEELKALRFGILRSHIESI